MNSNAFAFTTQYKERLGVLFLLKARASTQQETLAATGFAEHTSASDTSKDRVQYQRNLLTIINNINADFSYKLCKGEKAKSQKHLHYRRTVDRG